MDKKPKAINVTTFVDTIYADLLAIDAAPEVLNLVSEYVKEAKEVQEAGQFGDGYHTFEELYQHRVRLFTCLMHAHKNRAWWSHKHSDGSQWDGWIIAGIQTPQGMVSYHLPVTEIPYLPEGIELQEGRLWDGHTAEDVLNRLPSLNFGRTDGTAFIEPVEEEEQAVYQYVAAVATANGFIHYDGILHGPMISGIEDYHRYRAEIASDAGVKPEQIQVRSLAIVGMAPSVPKNDG